jgi:signal transduction histidine kinase
LVRRPRGRIDGGVDQVQPNPISTAKAVKSRGWMIWAISLGVWSFVSLAGTLTFWQLYRSTDMPMSFRTTLGLELSQILTYVPLTPLVFWLATRYPIRRDNWKSRTLLYLGAGVLFCVAHVTLRGATHFALYNSKEHAWNSAIWNPQTHAFAIQWAGLRRLFLNNLVDDITGTFVPIVLIAHAISYYRKYQDRESRATQLEGQLAKAHLQALKSQLQPHFLFNTMHSVSALMLTDVQAADRMITRLADLLRMNLESAGTQITTLSREMEFVHCYLEIEQVRFEERLTLIFDIAPETLDAQVPLLLLQPLVDNAVKHGISHLTEGGEIHISSHIHNDDLRLEVRDNGPGFTGSKQERGFGLGLRVTRERLQTLYGKNQSVEVASPREGGVSVVVTIPFRIRAVSVDDLSADSHATLPVELQESA